MNWYKHDTDATQDAKIRKLIIRHGATGYAVYFHCLELIAAEISESNLTFELEHDSEIIADNLKITGDRDQSGRDIVEEIMRTIVDLGLFQESQGHIFCFKLLKRLDTSMTSNSRFRELISDAKGQKSLTPPQNIKNHDGIMTPSCYHHESPHASLQEEIRKEEKRKEEPSATFTFESFAKQCAESWNGFPIKPAFRFTTSSGLTGKEREGFLTASDRYSMDEIMTAMRNYHEIGKSAEHELFPNGYRLAGFLAGGVEQYMDDADPWTRCRKKSAASTPEKKSSVEVPDADETAEYLRLMREYGSQDEPTADESVMMAEWVKNNPDSPLARRIKKPKDEEDEGFADDLEQESFGDEELG